MKREKEFEVPFAVMRQIGTSMEDQLVSGFARVIRSGAYADGTALPGIRKLAVMFGVSEITVRNAVKRLCRDGLLAARSRVGLTVCAPGGRSWRGTVLGIKASPPGAYYVSVVESAMSDALRRNGWLYSSVSVPSEGAADLSMLELMLSSATSLAITFNATRGVTKRLVNAGVGFFALEPNEPASAAAYTIRIDSSVALAELAAALKRKGVRRVLSVYQHPSVATTYSSVLEANGLSVRNLRVKPIGGHNTQECVQRAGLVAFERILSHGGIAEDAVVCNDDYLAAGILSAFDHCAVEVPGDVRFATLAHRGLGPVYRKELTRIEHDPAQTGVRIGEAIVRYLETGAVPADVLTVSSFCPGGTI